MREAGEALWNYMSNCQMILRLKLIVVAQWQSCPTLFNHMDDSMPDFPVLDSFLEFAQTHVYWVSDAI